MALSGRERHSSRQVVFHNPVSTVVESLGRLDNDDNGESAAGGRLAHLLQILVCILSFCYYAKIVFLIIIQHFSGCQKCAGHRYAVLWRDPFRVG